MLHTHGISIDQVTTNGRFDTSKFRERVIDVSEMGTRINPQSLVRLAKELGANGDLAAVHSKLKLSFDVGNTRLKRRRGDGCYVYEKIA